MNPRDNMVAHLYADYVSWCKSNLIEHETFMTFCNQVRDYSDGTLQRMKDEYAFIRGMDELADTSTPLLDIMGNQIMSDIISLKPVRYHPPAETIRGAKMEFQPIQPNDEARAVAEVIRMLGGKS